jgi:hypothetical protein
MILLLSLFSINSEGLKITQVPATFSSILCIIICHFTPTQWFFNGTLIQLNIGCFVLSLGLSFAFNQGAFDKIKLSGKYDVASRDLFLKDKGQAYTVYYPMDKHLRGNELNRWWLNYRRDDRTITGLRKAFRALLNLNFVVPEQFFYQWRNFTINVVADAPLAKEFSDGKQTPRCFQGVSTQ